MKEEGRLVEGPTQGQSVPARTGFLDSSIDNLEGICFCVTAKNCEKTIVPTLRTILEALGFTSSASQCEIWVIDDGSSDATFAHARDFLRKLPSDGPRGYVTRNRVSRGMANSFYFAASRTQLKYMIPLIGTNNLKATSLAQLISAQEPNTITLAYRKDLWKTRPLAKAIASRALNGILAPLFGFPFREVTGIAMWLTKDVVDFVPPSAGHGVMVFVIAGALARKRKIKEITVETRADRSGKNTAKFPNPEYAFMLFKALATAQRHARRKVSNPNPEV